MKYVVFSQKCGECCGDTGKGTNKTAQVGEQTDKIAEVLNEVLAVSGDTPYTQKRKMALLAVQPKPGGQQTRQKLSKRRRCFWKEAEQTRTSPK